VVNGRSRAWVVVGPVGEKEVMSESVTQGELGGRCGDEDHSVKEIPRRGSSLIILVVGRY
jgi:hypothetical protein